MGTSRRIIFRLPEELHAKLQTIAKDNQTTISEVIRYLIEYAIEKGEAEERNATQTPPRT